MVVIVVLAVTLIVVNTGDSSTTVADDPTTSTTTLPQGGGGSYPTDGTEPPTTSEQSGSPDQSTLYAIGDAMQRYVDALNTRDRNRIAGTVCSEARSAVEVPTEQGTLVLERLALRSVNGDIAESTVTTHLELGSQQTSPEQNAATFRREDATWYYCPGAEPGITA